MRPGGVRRHQLGGARNRGHHGRRRRGPARHLAHRVRLGDPVILLHDDDTQLPTGSITESACAALRTATDAAHQRLHLHRAFAGLLSGELSRDGYARLLLRLHGLHVPIEERLARHDGAPLMRWRQIAASPSRPDLLRRDLSAIGIAAAAVAGAPRADAMLPALGDVAAALGCAWVVEGSALGGTLLARRVGGILGGEQGGGDFLSRRAGQTERWRGCRAAIEACGTSDDGRAIMVRASAATFDAFEAWLRDVA